ncbi:MAG TPA: DUF5996 family protein [Miltoncostaeaceae bacterium]|nr:DUF5996 family protein [Miltoncostaeaceae bacterium]
MSDAPWPALPYRDWEPTKQTVHRLTQIVGKVRMALVPFRNHWWHVTLYPSATGLTTGLMPYGARSVQIDLDLVAHRLEVRTSDGGRAVVPLADGVCVADLYAGLFAALAEVDVAVTVDPRPFDLGGSPRLDEDRGHASYDADAVTRWWTVLRRTEHVLLRFGAGFTGKASPVHLFWHSFDLAHGRFSGRPAAPIPGADPVTAAAYSHEVVAVGWWPGDDRRTPFPAFYSYTAPEPAGLRDRPLRPAAAEWQDTGNGSMAILPYDAVREAADPEGDLLAFFETAYAAGAEAAGWDRAALEAEPPLR